MDLFRPPSAQQNGQIAKKIANKGRHQLKKNVFFLKQSTCPSEHAGILAFEFWENKHFYYAMKKVFVKFFAKFFEVFAVQSFRKLFEVFASFSRLSDPFGPIGMHSDAFGSNWKRLDVFEFF